ncbi:MAG: RNA polymerase sigma factor [Planctomycetota bacterium]|nr:MAG: RNA polymerase sigma factor [Planctomycetota bacterium]
MGRATRPAAGAGDEQAGAKPGAGAQPEPDADAEALVEQARAGSTEAFEELFRRYRDKVFGVVFGYVRDREDALDITQDAFLKAYRHLDRFAGRSGFFTWVTQIAINRAIDVRRRRMRRKVIALPERAEPEHNPRLPRRGEAPPVGERLEEQELRERYLRALDRLSEKHRTVFILHTVEGLAYKEIARVLGISIGTVMSRLHYARKNLQRELEGYLRAAGLGPPSPSGQRRSESGHGGE